MYIIEFKILNKILNNQKIKYSDGTISNELFDKKIIEVNDIPFDDYILDYANKNNLALLSYSYEYPSAFKSINDFSIRNYTFYPELNYLPLSDNLMKLISNFLYEYDSCESNTFVDRSYEVFKIISDELSGKAIVLFEGDMN